VSAGQPLARLTPPEGGGGEVTIVSPVAGVIGASTGVVGAQVSAGGQPLFRIIARGEFDLVGEASAKDMAKIAVNQPAKIKVVGAGVVEGRVRRVSSAIEPVTQLGQVRVAVTSRQRLLINSSGRATIKTGESCNVSVPLTAVLYGGGGTVVQVIRRQRVETRRVEIGLMSGGQVEIKEGLSDGDIVAARAGGLLREGDPVRTIAADAAAK
jgi:RND family efflux transporter MFP subunit